MAESPESPTSGYIPCEADQLDSSKLDKLESEHFRRKIKSKSGKYTVLWIYSSESALYVYHGDSVQRKKWCQL